MYFTCAYIQVHIYIYLYTQNKFICINQTKGLAYSSSCPENRLMTVYSVTSATVVFKHFERKPC